MEENKEIVSEEQEATEEVEAIEEEKAEPSVDIDAKFLELKKYVDLKIDELINLMNTKDVEEVEEPENIEEEEELPV